MPRVRCISLAGVDLVFFSNDHDPPHLHAVKRDHWHYRAYILVAEDRMLEKKSGPRAMSGGMRKVLCSLVALHRMELLEEWEATRPDA